MLVTEIRPDGSINLGEQAWALGYETGKLVRVIRTSADTLILALYDEPVMIEAPAKRLSGPGTRALTQRGRMHDREEAAS